MPTLELDRFAAWIRERSRGCLENSEINALLYGGFEEDDQWTFQDQATQAQWEAWLAGQFFEDRCVRQANCGCAEQAEAKP